MNVIDLFSGCGGLSLGFQQAGFHVALGIDNDAAALETFRRNHKDSVGASVDLFDAAAMDRIEELLEGQKVDVIVAGPPCQGFSLTGPRKFDDPRNKLYLRVFDAVRRFKPQGFVIENVRGMASLYGGQVKDEIIRRFTELGYNVVWKVVCAADYGVPQLRHRLIFVGIRRDLGTFEFPKAKLTPDHYIGCRDAIGDLPTRVDDLGAEMDSYQEAPFSDYQKLMRGNAVVLANHVGTKHTEHVKNVISMVPPGGNYKDLPPGVGDSRKFHVAWTRYHPDRPSNTIDTGHRNHFHYALNRVPTIREFARLQSFPDDFVFTGTKTQQNRQVGNAVPPLLGQAIAEQLSKYLKG
ncbi:DNA cytosine methyltransferase [Sutterella sp.]|uniref:DNA cytosine methyltransferase n=1 Tax=Sutterella sp. TaxID=1981025 RepID=UPI003FD7B712